ncbi:hypothetical protein C1645_836266 [Glomus cerebriforme]|uniref:Uncharacterized protein n=1 Tax=Glomus cerebriforme TaxID=658196 RepID=A0A397S797_9GLOM|nr:hypothetical protein C1645_836266 [Glomus cerebriforme]
MGIMVLVEEVAIFEGFGAKEVSEQDVTLLQVGITPVEQDIKIREFLNTNGAMAALIKMIATLVHAKIKEQIKELCKTGYIANLLANKNEIKQLQLQIEYITNQYMNEKMVLQNR